MANGDAYSAFATQGRKPSNELKPTPYAIVIPDQEMLRGPRLKRSARGRDATEGTSLEPRTRLTPIVS